MTGDYATDLFRRYAGNMSERRATQTMKTLDRTMIQLFAQPEREAIRHLLPGLERRMPERSFGLTPKSLRSQTVISWNQALTQLREDLRITTVIAEDLFDAYLKAHVTLMTPRARLSFTEVSSDDLVRAYLRAIES